MDLYIGDEKLGNRTVAQFFVANMPYVGVMRG